MLRNSSTWWYVILLSVAFTTIDYKLLMAFGFHNTALPYVGIPFIVALILVIFRKPYIGAGWRRIHRNLLVDGLIIMFASSLLLGEGFICVLFSLPIYLLILAITYAATAAYKRAQERKSHRIGVHIIPLLIFLSAFEGVVPETSFDRYEQVTVTRIVPVPVSEIRANLIKPIQLQKDRPWFLGLFPMPYKIEAESLNPGDVHEIHLRYYRWFIANVHEGSMRLEISEVEANRVKTTFLSDTSYFSNYLELKGTEIRLNEIDAHRTEVSLNIDYNRKLDPYWYFGPIQRYGVGLTAGFLIDEVIARENG